MNDLIDRQAAIDIVEFECGEWRGLAKTITKEIEHIPPAQSECKKGEWIKKISKKEKDKEYIGYTPYWYCSECGKRYEPAIANTIINYCYNCGADMRGEKDDRFNQQTGIM